MERLYRDFFFFPDISILISLLVAGVGIAAWQGITLYMSIFFLVGMFSFAFSEYLTHRYFFHIKTPKNPFFLKFMKRIHYDHHTDPKDLKLLFLPLWYSLPNFFIFSGIFYYLSKNIMVTLSFGLGLIAMLLVYEWKHYVAHRPIKPKTKFGQWAKKMHTLHHYKNENYWYGVSSPLMDVLFGTLKEEKEVKLSETARDLQKRA
ncbi:sterol desaturase family protein [Mesobacillus harenae]|uniref:sterol desaturase family protein n=1 Tax=Mesobacillus harenae TaxID=2213203 RepID=UPI00158044F4|nr:sterol desaturase family protein [Mesobacillus harenae]